MDETEARSFLDGAAPEPIAETLPAAVMGRPTTYSEDLALHICERLADGESLRAICAAKDMPHRASVFRWLDDHPEFKTFYAYAMQAKVEDRVDEMFDIADDKSGDVKIEVSEEGAVAAAIDKAKLARDEIRIDLRKWWVGVSMPRKYGALVGQAPEILPPSGTAGDGAKVINPAEPTVIENDPLYASFKAFEKVGKKA